MVSACSRVVDSLVAPLVLRVAAPLAAVVSLAAADVSFARSGPGPHDGVYAVDIITQRGSCDRAYRWTITVSGGRISSPADGFMVASGQITERGAVSVSFRRDNQVANVAGKIKGGAASGVWSSETLQCGGSWRAVRVG